MYIKKHANAIRSSRSTYEQRRIKLSIILFRSLKCTRTNDDTASSFGLDPTKLYTDTTLKDSPTFEQTLIHLCQRFFPESHLISTMTPYHQMS